MENESWWEWRDAAACRIITVLSAVGFVAAMLMANSILNFVLSS